MQIPRQTPELVREAEGGPVSRGFASLLGIRRPACGAGVGRIAPPHWGDSLQSPGGNRPSEDVPFGGGV